MKPRKRFGQHFLTAPAVIDDLVDAIAPRPDDVMLEIGPGRGALTERLIERTDKLTVVELDRDLVPLLEARFRGLAVIAADVLNVDIRGLAAPGTLRVVGNVPYNISSPLLFKLLDARVRDIHLMLQREVVARLGAQPGTKSWGRLGVMAQRRGRIEPLFDVGPDAFDPPPKVWSRVVRISPRPEPPAGELVRLDRIVRTAFSARRKRLSNALRGLPVDYNVAGVDPSRRPDSVSVCEFVALAATLPDDEATA